MAILFSTLTAAITGTGAAAGATAGTAVGAGAGALSGLSTVTTVLGGLASIAAGQQQASAQRAAAVQEETMAVQEELQGRQDALNALRALNQDQAAIAAAGFASGIGGQGVVATAQAEAQQIAEQNIETSRTGARLRSAARRGQADQLRSSAAGSSLGGFLQAGAGGLSLLERRQARG